MKAQDFAAVYGPLLHRLNDPPTVRREDLLGAALAIEALIAALEKAQEPRTRRRRAA